MMRLMSCLTLPSSGKACATASVVVPESSNGEADELSHLAIVRQGLRHSQGGGPGEHADLQDCLGVVQFRQGGNEPPLQRASTALPLLQELGPALRAVTLAVNRGGGEAGMVPSSLLRCSKIGPQRCCYAPPVLQLYNCAPCSTAVERLSAASSRLLAPRNQLTEMSHLSVHMQV